MQLFGLEKKYAYEDKQIDSSIENATPEKILFDIRELISEQIAESSRINKRLDDKNEQLQYFINTFVSRMDNIFTNQHKQIEDNVKSFFKQQLKKTNDDLTISTKQLIEEQREGLSFAMKSVADDLKSCTKEISSTLSNFSNTIDNRLGDISNTLNDRLTDINNNYERMFNSLNEKQSEFANKMLNDFNSSIKQSMEDISSQQVSKTAEAMENIIEHSELVCQQIVSINENISDSVKALSDSVTDNVESLKNCYDFISEHIASIKADYESAVLAYQDAVASANRNNENQEQLLTEFSKCIESIAGTNILVAKMLNANKSEKDNTNNVIAQINKIGEAIVSLNKLEQTLNKIANK